MYEIAVILAFTFSSFVFAYLSMNIDKKHPFLQLLFLGSSLFMMLTSVGFSMANTNAQIDVMMNQSINISDTHIKTTMNSGYTVVMWGMVISMTYLTIAFLIQMLQMLVGLQRKGKGGG